MKKHILFLLLFSFSTYMFSQVRVTVLGSEVYVKKQHVFNVVATGYSSTCEYVVINTQGNPLLAFVPFKIQDGWRSESSDTQNGGYHSKSGTSYTYFFRVSSTSGDFCDIPANGLSSIRTVAKYVLSFGLIKTDALDAMSFQQFCAMHGKVYENLKYFK